MFHVTECGMVKIADHMKRHSIQPGNFLYLKLSGFQKLCFIVGDGNRRVFHALFQNCGMMRVRTAIGTLPGISYTLWIFNDTRMFQYTGWTGTVGEKGRTIVFTGKRNADCILCKSNGRISHQAVIPKSGNMQHIFCLHDNIALLFQVWIGFIVATVDVDQTISLVTVYSDLIRHQRIQPQYISTTVSDNLCISIAVNQQMGH